MDCLQWKTDATGSTNRKYSSGRKHTAHTSKNIDIDVVEDLVFLVKQMHLLPKLTEPCVTLSTKMTLLRV